jgi:pimeloyl-ACP methyl ester carboxylesterase
VDVRDNLVDHEAGTPKSASDRYKEASVVNKLMFDPQPTSYDQHSAHLTPYLQWVRDDTQRDRMFPMLIVPYSNLRGTGERGANRVVMYFHGNAEDLGDILERMKKISVWTEAHVCAVEYPGYGPLVGTPTESSTENVARQAISYVCRENPVTHENIIVFGRSIGAAVAAKVVSKYGQQTTFGGLILQSPFLSVQEYTEVGGFTGFVLSSLNKLAGGSRQFESSTSVQSIGVRTLVVHGALDDVIPLDHGKRLFELCGSEDKSFYVDERGDHDRFEAEGLKLELLDMILGCKRTSQRFEMAAKPLRRMSRADQQAVAASCKRAEGRLRVANLDHWL